MATTKKKAEPASTEPDKQDYFFVRGPRLDKDRVAIWEVKKKGGEFKGTVGERGYNTTVFGWGPTRKLLLGCIYKVKRDMNAEGLTLYFGSAELIRTWPDNEARAEWRYVEQETEARLAMEKMAKTDPLIALVEPLGRVYRKQRGIGRRLMLAKIVQLLENGEPK